MCVYTRYSGCRRNGIASLFDCFYKNITYLYLCGGSSIMPCSDVESNKIFDVHFSANVNELFFYVAPSLPILTDFTNEADYSTLYLLNVLYAVSQKLYSWLGWHSF